MIYVKHYYIDPVTKEPFYDGSMGPNGKTHPAIPNLDVKFQFVDENGATFCLSTVDPAVNITPFLGAEVITFETFVSISGAEYAKRLEERNVEIYNLVKGIKTEVIDKWWHHSEITAAMTIKVEESKLAVEALSEEDARVVAPFVAMEADAREIQVIDLANRILNNYNGLIAGEAIVSGHRGKLTDAMENIPFVPNTVTTIQESFQNLNEFDITEGFDVVRASLGL